MKLSESRWLKSRHLLFAMALCLMAYLPAIFGPNKALWIPVFGSVAVVIGGAVLGKNALDSYRHGPYTQSQDRPFPEDT